MGQSNTKLSRKKKPPVKSKELVKLMVEIGLNKSSQSPTSGPYETTENLIKKIVESRFKKNKSESSKGKSKLKKLGEIEKIITQLFETESIENLPRLRDDLMAMKNSKNIELAESTVSSINLIHDKIYIHYKSFLPFLKQEAEGLDEAPEQPETNKEDQDLAKKGDRIKENMLQVYEAIGKKKRSALYRLSKWWGKLSIWKKVLVCVGVVTTPIVAVVFAHSGVVITICAVVIAGTVGGSILLQNNYKDIKHDEQNMIELKKGFIALANVLTGSIGLLESVRKEFYKAVKMLATESGNLKELVIRLKDEIARLTNLNDNLSESENVIRSSTNNLRVCMKELDFTYKDQKGLMKAIVQLVWDTHREIGASKSQLNDLTDDLKEKKKSIKKKLHNMNAAREAMLETTQTSLGILDEQGKQKAANQDKSTTVLNDTQSRIVELEKQLKEATDRVRSTNQERTESNTNYEILIKEQENQNTQLKQIIKQLSNSKPGSELQSETFLSTNSIFAVKIPNPLLVQKQQIQPNQNAGGFM